MRALAVVFGIFLVVGGIALLAMPNLTFLSLAWLVGLCMIAEGIGEIFTWSYSARKDTFSLVASILSIVVGLIVVFSSYAQAAVDIFLIYALAVWLTVLGIITVFKSIRSAHTVKLWWLSLLLGLLVTACGVVGFFYPVVMAMSLGMFAGLAVLFTGMNLISVAFA